MKTQKVTQKPYKGFLKNTAPGSTVEAGRNIVGKRDLKYAEENGINLVNDYSRTVRTAKSLGLTDSTTSIGSIFKKIFKSIFK